MGGLNEEMEREDRNRNEGRERRGIRANERVEIKRDFFFFFMRREKEGG